MTTCATAHDTAMMNANDEAYGEAPDMAISAKANNLIKDFERTLTLDSEIEVNGGLHVGVDLGTAYIVTAVVDDLGTPIAGALTRSRSFVRDGLVLDYVGAIKLLKQQVQDLTAAGFELVNSAVAYPPGTSGRNAKAFGHVLEAAGLDVCGMLDEPSAAANVLDIENGAVVDIGGGTTGISILKGGEVVFTADEPTGGTHVDLVLSGHFGVPQEEAEVIKRDVERQPEVLQLIKPVFEKMASITNRHLRGHNVDKIYLVGGTSCFPGIEAVIADETGIKTVKPENPLLVTPLGIALGCRDLMLGDKISLVK